MKKVTLKSLLLARKARNNEEIKRLRREIYKIDKVIDKL